MKIYTTLQSTRIRMKAIECDDTYYIEQDGNGRFYITSENGYNEYEGTGSSTLEAAIAKVKKMIKNYFIDRCIN